MCKSEIDTRITQRQAADLLDAWDKSDRAITKRVKVLEHRAFLYERCGLFDLAEVLHQQAAKIEMERRGE